MSAYNALLGNVWNNGSPVELGGGLNFIGFTVQRNADTGRIDITDTGGGGGPSPGGAPVDVTKATAAAGTATTYSRTDHKHNVSTAAPAAFSVAGVAAAEGAATTLARSDHVHSLTGVLPGVNGGTGLSTASLGQLFYWNGSGFTAFGPTAVLYNTNANASKQLSDGARWLLDDANNSTGRTFTLGTTGATEGRCVSFICKVTSANPYTLDYGTGTMAITTSRTVSFRFSASFGWELAGWEG
jgi:hypothetical protein